jgi:hypothetical protein
VGGRDGVQSIALDLTILWGKGSGDRLLCPHASPVCNPPPPLSPLSPHLLSARPPRLASHLISSLIPCARSCGGPPSAGARSGQPTAHHARASWAGPLRTCAAPCGCCPVGRWGFARAGGEGVVGVSGLIDMAGLGARACAKTLVDPVRCMVYVSMSHTYLFIYLEGAVERAVAVHDDEAEAIVVLQQLAQRLRVELAGRGGEKGWGGLGLCVSNAQFWACGFAAS